MERKPFTIVTNNITYLVVTLCKHVKYLYEKNFKFVKKKKSKMNSEDGKFSHDHGTTVLT